MALNIFNDALNFFCAPIGPILDLPELSEAYISQHDSDNGKERKDNTDDRGQRSISADRLSRSLCSSSLKRRCISTSAEAGVADLASGSVGTDVSLSVGLFIWPHFYP